MTSEWYKAESMDKPEEWDTASSPTTVYQRKNITEQTRKDESGDDLICYAYDERTMSREEYAALQADLESPATKMIMQQLSAVEMNLAMVQEMMED